MDRYNWDSASYQDAFARDTEVQGFLYGSRKAFFILKDDDDPSVRLEVDDPNLFRVMLASVSPWVGGPYPFHGPCVIRGKLMFRATKPTIVEVYNGKIEHDAKWYSFGDTE